ncbi:hypothetical protein CTAYLR_007137 [Chrysophaeum taylorii]|uniref:DM10 domain-containing protein n=1 Tax=Chrysophaeum taylorii TaxID=2483200 RepID=A0AAD7U7A5_9STRA|nr:hypothetical protein CTAYLR_007137 [Chrysophaeum taylorii]
MEACPGGASTTLTAWEPEEALPSLPGFRSNRHATGNKKQTMKYINRHMFLTEARHAVAARQSDLVASNSATSLALRSFGKATDAPSRRPQTSGSYFGGRVLCFYAYFKEAVQNSSIETCRVRRCELYYYVCDDSIQIVEPKLENSGVPQGNFMKRHRVPKPHGDEFFTLDDIEVGSAVELYGRTFYVYGCNASTRAFLTEHRGEPASDELPPIDRYEALREELTSRETGKNPRVSHNIQKNPMKVFAEAALGNTVDNSGRSGFLKYGTSVLRFYCYWDDSQSLYGDVQLFKLHYFLYDNTIEILTVHAPNSGRERSPLFLKRAKLPKQTTGFYHWTDLRVGGEIDVYARPVRLIDADRSTRAFYQKEAGVDLAPRLLPPVVAEVLPTTTTTTKTSHRAPLGSDGDSLTSSSSRDGSLARKARPRNSEAVLLRYRAEFAEPKHEDIGRVFVLLYDIADGTIQVREPPRRNSGIVGGNFLAKVELADAPLVGTSVIASGHAFKILDADEATLKFMEAHASEFPLSHFPTVRGLYADYAKARFHDDNCRAALAALLGPKTKLSFGEFENILANFVPPIGQRGPPKHAAITFWRAAGKDGALPADALLQIADP